MTPDVHMPSLARVTTIKKEYLNIPLPGNSLSFIPIYSLRAISNDNKVLENLSVYGYRKVIGL